MIAVIETGGKQYTVQVGNTILVEKIEGKENDTVSFAKVLLTANEETGATEIGMPFLEVGVEGKIIAQGKGDKIRVFKMKPKKRYQKTQGHRQQYTKVQITKIGTESPAKKKNTVAQKETATKPAPKKQPAAVTKKTTAKKPAAKKSAATSKKETK